ncbi:carotenoid biosynthesis protein [Bradyrhizobium sp. 25ACV]
MDTSNGKLRCLWLFPILYLGYVIVNTTLHLVPSGASAAITIMLLAGFALFHGLRRYEPKELAAFAAITFVASNLYENLSVLTGFPFGFYHYSESLGPKLFHVPVLIAPAYLAAGYLAWTLAAVLLGIFDRQQDNGDLYRQSFVAGFVLTMWDLTLDPVAATIQRQWIWHQGGSYFGVPIVNFAGWLLCALTMFVCFSLYLARSPVKPGFPLRSSQPRAYWYQGVAMYAVLGLMRPILALTVESEPVTDATGQVWQTGQIYQAVTLVTCFTMWFVALLAALLIGRTVGSHDGRTLG